MILSVGMREYRNEVQCSRFACFEHFKHFPPFILLRSSAHSVCGSDAVLLRRFVFPPQFARSSRAEESSGGRVQKCFGGDENAFGAAFM
jgi:hypothetical protein